MRARDDRLPLQRGLRQPDLWLGSPLERGGATCLAVGLAKAGAPGCVHWHSASMLLLIGIVHVCDDFQTPILNISKRRERRVLGLRVLRSLCCLLFKRIGAGLWLARLWRACPPLASCGLVPRCEISGLTVDYEQEHEHEETRLASKSDFPILASCSRCIPSDFLPL